MSFYLQHFRSEIHSGTHIHHVWGRKSMDTKVHPDLSHIQELIKLHKLFRAGKKIARCTFHHCLSKTEPNVRGSSMLFAMCAVKSSDTLFGKALPKSLDCINFLAGRYHPNLEKMFHRLLVIQVVAILDGAESGEHVAVILFQQGKSLSHSVEVFRSLFDIILFADNILPQSINALLLSVCELKQRLTILVNHWASLC